MSFISLKASGECPICFFDLKNDVVAHENGGEHHPIHRKCLETWIKNQQTLNRIATCPTCSKHVISVESNTKAAIRKCLDAIENFLNKMPGSYPQL